MFNTPLIFAIEKENLELIKMLVDAGADVNNGKKFVKSGVSGNTRITDFEYWTPLDVAKKAKKPNKEIIAYLVSKGAVAYQK